jgi:NADH-quinone oxidoreductase subunit N
MNLTDLFSILPLLVLIIWAMVLLLVDLAIPKDHKGWTALLASLGMLVSMIITLVQHGQVQAAGGQAPLTFNNMIAQDGFSDFLHILFLGAGLAGVALSYDYLKRMGIDQGEYYVLLLTTISGMMLMSQAADLIIVFLALELLSIPLYVMAGFARPRLDSEEAALKYFLLGTFASGFVLYGIAMLYGGTGHTDLQGIVVSVKTGLENSMLFMIGAGFLIVGFGFKIALVPFQMWTPDVYQGAPSPVTGFMSVGAKAAGFAALLRVFVSAFPALSVDLYPVFWALAALTMIVGNVVAIAQTNIKRMLAYSSIAHAGYILMAFVPYGQGQATSNSIASALFYLMAYAFTSFGAWSVVIALEKAEGNGLQLDDYAGLGRKHRLLAIAMAIFMFSFTGLPPTLGFMGKFYLFRTALEGGYVGLAILGVLTSLVSAYYYLRVVVIMFMKEGEPDIRRDTWLGLTTAVAALGVVLLSLAPDSLFAWVLQAVLHIM